MPHRTGSSSCTSRHTNGSRSTRSRTKWSEPSRRQSWRARFLYFFRAARGRVYVLTAYVKNVQSDLTPEQRKRILRILDDLE